MKTMPLPDSTVPKDISRIFDNTIDPLVRLQTIGDEEFEIIVCEWASGYLAKTEPYKNVAQMGGSRNSGRDIVAYLDDSLQVFDIFQCKRYKNPLAPSEYMVEFGKLCYYTMIGKYKVPRKYYIVASNGIGPELRELIEKPDTINKKLIDAWDKKCAPKKKITAEGVPLTEQMKTYVEGFDFSIVSDVAPVTLLEQFAQTSWYKYHFGGGLRRRPRVERPQEELTSDEVQMEYISQLMQAYSHHENREIAGMNELREIPKLHNHFKRQRESFHNARALKRFARDEFVTDDVYDDVKNQVYHGVITVCEDAYDDDLKRIDETIRSAHQLQITSPELGDINILEKSGMCHDLVNEGEMRWVEDE